MFNLFGLFSSKPSPKKSRTSVPPDLAFMLVMKYAKNLEDFNDDDEFASSVGKFADELGSISHDKMTYDEAAAALRHLDQLSKPR